VVCSDIVEGEVLDPSPEVLLMQEYGLDMCRTLFCGGPEALGADLTERIVFVGKADTDRDWDGMVGMAAFCVDGHVWVDFQ
jgi:hypothetical protein